MVYVYFMGIAMFIFCLPFKWRSITCTGKNLHADPIVDGLCFPYKKTGDYDGWSPKMADKDGVVPISLALLHSERSKLHRVLAVLSAIGLKLKT